MEEAHLRFPHITEKVFKKIDLKNLLKCRDVSNFWRSMIDQQKEFWSLFIGKLFTVPQQKFGYYYPNDGYYYSNDDAKNSLNSAPTVPKNVEDFLRKIKKDDLITFGRNH